MIENEWKSSGKEKSDLVHDTNSDFSFFQINSPPTSIKLAIESVLWKYYIEGEKTLERECHNNLHVVC